jgi:hypothetical protein
MDGMIVQLHALMALSQDGSYAASFTINLPSATAAIAEVSVSSVTPLYEPNQTAGVSASCAFTDCVTDGSNAPLPAVENFAFGSISGDSRQVVIRNGLKSISYDIEVTNCYAAFIANVFFWPAVDRGNL